MAAAMSNSTWLRDLSHGFQDDMLDEFIDLSARLQRVTIQHGVRDSIIWKLTSDGVYSTQFGISVIVLWI